MRRHLAALAVLVLSAAAYWAVPLAWPMAAPEGAPDAAVTRPLRHEPPPATTTTTLPPTTTTLPPTTTTAPPPTTAPPAPPPAPPAAPAPAEAPAPAIDLWACAQGLATSIEVIPGDTSLARTDGTILVSQWHIDQGQATVCSAVAHEAGHLYAYRYGPGSPLGAPPTAFYSRDPEHWADCAAAVWTGWDRNGWCGPTGIASAAAIL